MGIKIDEWEDYMYERKRQQEDTLRMHLLRQRKTLVESARVAS